jgi:hypothetical protein
MVFLIGVNDGEFFIFLSGLYILDNELTPLRDFL